MARIESQALGGYFKTQDDVRPLIYRRLAAVTTPGSYAVVDPCAGEGEALCELVSAVFGTADTCGYKPQKGTRAEGVDVSLVAVELESERKAKCESAARAVVSRYSGAQVLHGDGLCCDAKGSASLLWLNPPYDFFRGQRFEVRFLNKWTGALGAGGVLILIIPEYVVGDVGATLTKHYEDVEVLKYPEPTYSEFKQVVVVATKRALECGDAAASVFTRGELADAPVALRTLPPGELAVHVHAVDVRGIMAAAPAWCGQAGYDRPATPPKVGLAMRSKPAHVAMALGSGIFNGVRLQASGRPDLLAKAVFVREYQDVKGEEKVNERGEVVKRVQVERPKLTLTTLNLDDGSFSSLDPGTTPSGGNEIKNFADLLLVYGDAMVSAMRERCPSLHDLEHDVALPTLARPLYPAQHHAAVAALKLLGRGQTPLILGEIGAGKSATTLSVCNALSPQHVAATSAAVASSPSSDPGAFPPLRPLHPVRRTLVVCPPHLVQNWIDEAGKCLPGTPVVELRTVGDVDKLSRLPGDFVVAVLSREAAKLGHGVEGVATPRCPRCGAKHGSDAEKLAQSRAVCGGELVEPLDAAARVAHEMWKLRRRGAAWNSGAFAYARRAAAAVLLRRLWLKTTRLKESWQSKRVRLEWEAEKALIAALRLVAPDPRVLRCLKASKIDAHGFLLKDFAHAVDDATLCTTLAGWGRWRRRKCGEPLYQAVPTPRRYPVAEYICKKHPRLFDMLVADECFVAGTLVSGFAIESIGVGQIIETYDEKRRMLSKARVLRRFKSKPAGLCRVRLGSTVLICTLNHPFMTQRGWVPAFALDSVRDIVLQYANAQENDLARNVQLLQSLDHYRGNPGLHNPSSRLRLLQSNVCNNSEECENREGEYPHVCGKPSDALCSDEIEQSKQIASDARSCQSSAEGQAVPPERRQRQIDGATGDFSRSARITHRNRNIYTDSKNPLPRDAYSIQGGPWGSRAQTSHRSGWGCASDPEGHSKRREENASLRGVRVDCIEILERTSDGTFGGVCPDGYVYNLEVEDTHTYFANEILVHNCHEYSNAGSAQAIAIHRLVEKVPYVLPLTGSLMNGYAKSLFANLWAVSPRMREEFDHGDAAKFAKLYGYQKRVLTGDAAKKEVVTQRGASSDRVVKTEGGERTQDAPGVLPSFVLRHVLPLSVTLHKRDINPDDRVVDHDRVEVPWDDSVGAIVRSRGAHLGSKLVEAVKRDRFSEKLAGKLFGQLAELPSYYDRASADSGNAGAAGARQYVVAYPEDVGGAVVAEADGVEASSLLPKERWLVAALRRELAQGRRCLIFLWHKDLASRLCRLVEDATGERPAFLDADKVPARKRQEWIDKNVVGKRRVLVTNPSCVQTGLNNLIWFSTAIFVENPGCNPFVARQAVGRLDRITQTEDVRVYWPVYEGVQAKVLDLLQTKSAISQQIDGIDPTAALEMAGGGAGEVESMDVGLAIYRYLGGE